MMPLSYFVAIWLYEYVLDCAFKCYTISHKLEWIRLHRIHGLGSRCLRGTMLLDDFVICAITGPGHVGFIIRFSLSTLSKGFTIFR